MTALGSARAVLAVTGALDVPGVCVRGIELGRHLVDASCTSPRWSGEPDLDMFVADVPDALALARRWGLTDAPGVVTPASEFTDAVEHLRWSGSITTAAGPVPVRVRTLRLLSTTPAV